MAKSKKKTPKRVLALGDLHSGHIIGLTPPSYQYGTTSRKEPFLSFGKLQKETWDLYAKTIKEIGEVDLLIVNGDCIDGRGDISGSTELITSDRLEQVNIAYEALSIIKAKNTHISYGTAYHTGKYEDYENLLAEKLNASISAHEWIDVNGCIFDVKHHIGSSGVPHGRHSAIAKERLWNTLWSFKDDQPNANIFIRSHVHYYNYCGGPDWVGITLPALQGLGSKYGARRCSGIVDFGMVLFEIDENGGWSWKPYITKIKSQANKVRKI